ncbi:proline racemase family protein [Synergistes jonesii]|uniref:Proline racemase n=1 Tax=Synergistes jonesii TaxID=2754 RepID=A0A073IVG7_9BACT|nr:proline racemase family protein [Synergistes jonesii]KEJ93555.1 proline racemase [Synergistes jonesii]OFB61387.1 proline racemase [Synergistes jonesii]OFB65335.1 proline racemase [Synergistes jonesii]OFB68685.1 proline racemase [Synergistes jonesii]OFB69351.1 proline racemase [Synergistes jonesii]
MKVGKLVAVVDSHTCGEPTRIVVGGAPVLKGRSMPERWDDFKRNHDDFRRFIMTEPRGHENMFGAVLVPPISEEADTGVIFCDSGGSVSMCGHGSIGLASAMINLKMVEVKEPYTDVTLDTPAGLVTISVSVKDGEAVGAVLRNVPAFVYRQGCSLYMPSLGKHVDMDICFGGSFFAMLDAEDFGLTLIPSESSKIKALGVEAIAEANKQFHVQHPLIAQNNMILLAEFGIYKNNDNARNCVVFGASNIDRSPCGTGTCAKMALLAAQGKLKPEEVFRHESIIGTIFEGHYSEKTKIGDFDAITPFVRGEANITGFNWLIEQSRDPLLPGFLLC